jgi:Copper binding periplasmic protein CusF
VQLLRPAVVASCALLAVLPIATASCRQHAGGHLYAGRGRVAQLPGPQGSRLLYLQHEPIDDFRDRQGKIVGMDSMTMPFPLADGVSLAGVRAGDPVAFELRVDWTAETEVEITSLRKLPAGTRLVFGQAHPPAH